MLIVISLAVSAVLLALLYLTLPNRAAAAGLCLGFTLVFGLCMSVPVALQGLLTLLVVLISEPLHLKRPALMAAAVGVTLVVYAGLFIGIADELDELDQLRADYPVTSLTDRLSYETANDATRDQQAARPVVLGSEVESNLQEQEAIYAFNWRADSLRRLHDRSADQFVMARGFGPVRMIGVGRGRIELPDRGPVALPPRADAYTPDASPTAVVADGPLAASPPSPERLFSMHQMGQRDFLNPERMGYVESRQHVAGFESHRFESVPSPGHPCGSPTTPWRVERLELVSLLRHSMPVAYLSKHLPRMDQLRDARTRPLNEFELTSLDQLRAEKDVVIDDAEGRIRMVGSLRAAQDCLQCHDVQRGALLGALSYELWPLGQMPPSPSSDTPLDPQAALPSAEFHIAAE